LPLQEPLLLATLAGVLLGIAAGAALRPAHLSPAAIALIGFPGELMLRLLKMLVLPLVAASMVSGVCSLRQADDGGGGGVRRLARLTAAFYVGGCSACFKRGVFVREGRVCAVHVAQGAAAERRQPRSQPNAKAASLPAPSRHSRGARLAAAAAAPLRCAASTAVAILVGIALVVIIHPGRGAPFDAIASAAGGCAAEGERQVQKEAEGARERHGGTAEALMGVARQVGRVGMRLDGGGLSECRCADGGGCEGGRSEGGTRAAVVPLPASLPLNQRT
jgi:hypothetical protein